MNGRRRGGGGEFPIRTGVRTVRTVGLVLISKLQQVIQV